MTPVDRKTRTDNDVAMPSNTSIKSADHQLQSLVIASCIEALGSGRFFPRFFQLMSQIAVIEQFMVFELDSDADQMRCRLAHNRSNPELGLELARLYAGGQFREDSLLQQLIAEVMNNPGEHACEVLLHRSLPAVYRQTFFNHPALNEKFAIAVRDEESGNLFYINFYRSAEKGLFTQQELERLKQAVPIVSALLIRQLRDNSDLQGQRHLLLASLSEREAQVCQMIARAHPVKTIAQTLNLSATSVSTYRQRAYQKLGIRRKTELIALLGA